MGYLFGRTNYLFITYIVTSKPKRISVAAGVVHMIISFFILAFHNDSLDEFIMSHYSKVTLCASLNKH